MAENNFDDCFRACRRHGKHTYKFGCQFEKVDPRQEPSLYFFSVRTADDGYPMGVYVPIPAKVFLPFLEEMEVDEQYDFLERLTRTGYDEQRKMVNEGCLKFFSGRKLTDEV